MPSNNKRKKLSREEELREYNNIIFNYKISAKPKGEKQKSLNKKIKENTITILDGPAGTGKSFVSIMTALQLLKNSSSKISKILLVKPLIEAGDSIGHLPGTVEEKMEPYMYSFHSIFTKMIKPSEAKTLMHDGSIQMIPLTFMRGATFDNSVIILDEAQNTTVTAIKLFITRLGLNSKMVIMGDSRQTDLKLRNGDKSGLVDSLERFQGINGLEYHSFDESDIIRNDILTEIIKRYDNING